MAEKKEKTTAAENKQQPAKPVTEKKEKQAPVKNYHISFRKDENKWQVKKANSTRALKLFNTQAEAIEYAKKTAGNQDVSITIHKATGEFRKQKY